MEPVSNTPAQNTQTPPAGNIQMPPQPAPMGSPKMSGPKSKVGKILASIIILILLGISAASGYTIYKNLSSKTAEPTACTLEAKICPDGSSVGREGPNCEFTPCPTATPKFDSREGWSTYSNQEYSFQLEYPNDWLIEETEGSTFLTITPPGADYYAKNLSSNDIGFGIAPSISAQVYDLFYSDFLKKVENDNYCHIEREEVETADLTSAFYCESEGAPFLDIFIALPLKNDLQTLRFDLTTTHQDNIDEFNLENNTFVVNADRETFKEILSTFRFTE